MSDWRRQLKCKHCGAPYEEGHACKGVYLEDMKRLRTRIATLEAERDGLRCFGNCDNGYVASIAAKWPRERCAIDETKRESVGLDCPCKHWQPRRESGE
jgi:hypothetical protein